MGAGSYGYDRAGDTTMRPDPAGGSDTLAWDVEGNLGSLTRPNGGATTSYVYSPDSSSLLLANDGTTKTLHLNGLQVSENDNTGALSADRFYDTGLGTTAVRDSNSHITYLIPDRQNTADLAIDGPTLTATDRYYTPFGQERDTGASPPTGWPTDQRGFLNEPTDPSTGLTSVGERQYNAVTATFLSVDPKIDTGSVTGTYGYAYADDNPVTFSDPAGQMYQPGGFDPSQDAPIPSYPNASPAPVSPSTSNGSVPSVRSGPSGLAVLNHIERATEHAVTLALAVLGFSDRDGLHSANALTRTLAAGSRVFRKTSTGSSLGRVASSKGVLAANVFTSGLFVVYDAWQHHHDGDGWTESILKTGFEYAGATVGALGGRVLGGAVGAFVAPESGPLDGIPAGIGSVVGEVGGAVYGASRATLFTDSHSAQFAGAANVIDSLPGDVGNLAERLWGIL